MKPEAINLRAATEADLAAVNEIYNHYVQHSTCTYQEQPESLEGRRQWFRHHGEQHPIIVAVAEGNIVGWGSLSAFHVRSAYRRTVENSVYVHHEQHRRGIGATLLRELIQRARQLGHHAIIAGIDAEQTASVALHTKFGFKQVGHLSQIGYKFNRWLDGIYMELILDPTE